MRKNVLAFLIGLALSGFSFADHHGTGHEHEAHVQKEGHGHGHGHGHKHKKIHVHGAIDLNYTYNFNKVDGEVPGNLQHDNQTMGLAEINFGGSMGSFDWFMDLAFAGQNTIYLPEVQNWLAQAYLTKHVTKDLSFTAGRMFSNVGFEGVYNKDNWNYSKSWAFELTGPWVHDGVALRYASDSGLGIGLYVYDGASTELRDSIIAGTSSASPTLLGSVKRDKAVSAQLSYGTEMFGVVYNFFHDEGTIENYHNVNITADLSPSTSVAVSAVMSDRLDLGDEYFGVAGYAKFKLYEGAYIAPRIELLNRENNEDIFSGTLTYGYNCHKSGDWRLEGRYDKADDTFTDVDNIAVEKDSQFSLALAWMKSF